MKLVIAGSNGSGAPEPWNLLHDVQYVLGAHTLGHTALYIDDCGAAGPSSRGASNETALAIGAAFSLFHAALGKHWHLHDALGESYGQKRERALEFLGRADLVLDVSRGRSALTQSDAPRAARARAPALSSNDFAYTLPGTLAADAHVPPPICVDFVRDHAEDIFVRPETVYLWGASERARASASIAARAGFGIHDATAEAGTTAADALAELAGAHLAILEQDDDGDAFVRLGFALALGVPALVLVDGPEAHPASAFLETGLATLRAPHDVSALIDAVRAHPQSLSEAALRSAAPSDARAVLEDLLARSREA